MVTHCFVDWHKDVLKLNVFPTHIIQTKNHFLVGTQWQYAKGTVTMKEEGFSCTCKKNPRVPCNHIKNVKLRLYGTFDEHYTNI